MHESIARFRNMYYCYIIVILLLLLLSSLLLRTLYYCYYILIASLHWVYCNTEQIPGDPRKNTQLHNQYELKLGELRAEDVCPFSALVSPSPPSCDTSINSLVKLCLYLWCFISKPLPLSGRVGPTVHPRFLRCHCMYNTV